MSVTLMVRPTPAQPSPPACLIRKPAGSLTTRVVAGGRNRGGAWSVQCTVVCSVIWCGVCCGVEFAVVWSVLWCVVGYLVCCVLCTVVCSVVCSVMCTVGMDLECGGGSAACHALNTVTYCAV